MKNNSGYGQIWTGSRTDGTRKLRLAHRVSYETFVGPILDTQVLDHLCRTPACINPEHLEEVTQNENLDRGRATRAESVERTRRPKRRHRLPFGDGSFYYREGDGRWVGAIDAGIAENGRRRRVSVSDRDEDRAWAKLQAKRQDVAQKARDRAAA